MSPIERLFGPDMQIVNTVRQSSSRNAALNRMQRSSGASGQMLNDINTRAMRRYIEREKRKMAKAAAKKGAAR